jgi:hypothetical protein
MPSLVTPHFQNHRPGIMTAENVDSFSSSFIWSKERAYIGTKADFKQTMGGGVSPVTTEKLHGESFCISSRMGRLSVLDSLQRPWQTNGYRVKVVLRDSHDHIRMPNYTYNKQFEIFQSLFMVKLSIKEYMFSHGCTRRWIIWLLGCFIIKLSLCVNFRIIPFIACITRCACRPTKSIEKPVNQIIVLQSHFIMASSTLQKFRQWHVTDPTSAP